MKPNFALSLSFDGIRLLHRSGSDRSPAWAPIGEVSLDSHDLAGELADLRAAALALEPDGIWTKVLLPPNQVRTVAIDDPAADDEDVRAALDGVEPGGADFLAFDRVQADGRTLVAAIPRETLDEAEDFAAGHGFRPVCFAASPPAAGFDGEAFFGETRLARSLPRPAQAERMEPSIVGDPEGDGWEPGPAGWGSDAEAEPVLAPQVRPARQVRGSTETLLALITRWVGSRRPAGEAQGRGRPRHLALIMMAVLLVAMAAVGVLAAASDEGLAGLLRRAPDAVVAEAPPVEPEAAPPVDRPAPEVTAATEPAVRPIARPAQPTTEMAVAAATAVAAAIEALPAAEPDRLAVAAAPGAAAVVTPEEADRVYAATGVWLRAPRLPLEAEGEAPPGAFVGTAAPAAAAPGDRPPSPAAPAVLSADPALPAQPNPIPSAAPPAAAAPAAEVVEAPAMAPEAPTDAPDEAVAFVNAMAAPPGTRPRLRPEPSAEAIAAIAAIDDGAPSDSEIAEDVAAPEAGALAFADEGAAPPTAGGVALAGLRPASRPPGSEAEPAPVPEALAAFAGPRPGSRPDGLAPAGDPAADAVAAALAGATAPVAPPAPDLQSTLAAIVDGAPDPLAGATARAVPAARLPDTRPQNFGQVVSEQLALAARAAEPQAGRQGRAEPEEAEDGEAEVASSAAARPSGPVSGGVAQAATVTDAMALREVNLIGVYGQPNARRALVRLGNGRYLRVGVGDRIEGGQVTAIGDNALNYSRRGRTETLVIPGT